MSLGLRFRELFKLLRYVYVLKVKPSCLSEATAFNIRRLFLHSATGTHKFVMSLNNSCDHIDK